MEKGKQTIKLPKGWIETSIFDLAVVYTGNTPSKKIPRYYGGDSPFFKPSDLNSGIVFHANETLLEEGKIVARILPKNSILVTSIGATIGKTGLIKKKALLINKSMDYFHLYLYHRFTIIKSLKVDFKKK